MEVVRIFDDRKCDSDSSAFGRSPLTSMIVDSSLHLRKLVTLSGRGSQSIIPPHACHFFCFLLYNPPRRDRGGAKAYIHFPLA
jgi:hypothetical protein